MPVETLTTWTCDRHGAQVVTTEADAPPKGWITFEVAGSEWLLCEKCWTDLLAFMDNKYAVEPRTPAVQDRRAV